jgi:hypothetical protein
MGRVMGLEPMIACLGSRITFGGIGGFSPSPQYRTPESQRVRERVKSEQRNLGWQPVLSENKFRRDTEGPA